ncbi:ABC transporter substrate-binding protein [Piscirickettsia litoralis]|uniref:SsuA/THI5-like domain-containing protein n=1 Tax=Piscirickettsia litoralis TaxID=1891921 RepID=A0ABX2ZZ35_9GAMM|nr:ABC transporter substrate-binding protein [Piscirickettsia litoralis]ODN41877.1 hypothetical protein BGC07_01475 [Piscirickettsia litoralis]
MAKAYLRPFVLAFCLLSFFGLVQAATNTNKPLTIVLDWFVNPDHAPLFVAKQQGFFKKHGIRVKIIPPADASDGPKLVAAGKADLALNYQNQSIMQINNGLPLIRVATLINQPLDTIAVLKSSNIHSIDDLKGKTIGYSTTGFEAVTIKTMLAKHHLTTKDVKLVNVNYNLIQSLITHRVDATIGMMRTIEPIQMALQGYPARLFYPEDNGVPHYAELIFEANKKNINDPRLPAFIKALQEGVAYLKEHPKKTWHVFAKNHPELNNELNYKSWLATYPYFDDHPNHYSLHQYQVLLNYMKKHKLMKKNITR